MLSLFFYLLGQTNEQSNLENASPQIRRQKGATASEVEIRALSGV